MLPAIGRRSRGWRRSLLHRWAETGARRSTDGHRQARHRFPRVEPAGCPGPAEPQRERPLRLDGTERERDFVALDLGAAREHEVTQPPMDRDCDRPAAPGR